jgi:hypothetical protein
MLTGLNLLHFTHEMDHLEIQDVLVWVYYVFEKINEQG